MERRNIRQSEDSIEIKNEELMKIMRQANIEFEVDHPVLRKRSLKTSDNFMRIVKRTIPTICAKNILSNQKKYLVKNLTTNDSSQQRTKTHTLTQSSFLPYSVNQRRTESNPKRRTFSGISFADLQKKDQSMLALKQNISNILAKVEDDKQRRRMTLQNKIKYSFEDRFRKFWKVLPKVSGCQENLYENKLPLKTQEMNKIMKSSHSKLRKRLETKNGEENNSKKIIIK